MFTKIALEIGGSYAPRIDVAGLQSTLCCAWNNFAAYLQGCLNGKGLPQIGSPDVSWWFVDDWKGRHPHDTMPADIELDRNRAIREITLLIDLWWSSTLHAWALRRGFIYLPRDRVYRWVGTARSPGAVADELVAHAWPHPAFNPPAALSGHGVPMEAA